MAITVVSTPESAGWLVPYALNVTPSIIADVTPWTAKWVLAERTWNRRALEGSS